LVWSGAVKQDFARLWGSNRLEWLWGWHRAGVAVGFGAQPRNRLVKVKSAVPTNTIEQAILVIRGQRVILDASLAELYGVETKTLVRAVRRNVERFPADFMLKINKDEFESLRYQFGTSNSRGGRRYLPHAFTEQGVAMLSSVLRSSRAIQVNIEIVRAFVRHRRLLRTHVELAGRLDVLEKKYDSKFPS
jgi:hypothetical protein